MKFLLNMNMPREFGARLRAIGFECKHVGDIGMSKAEDIEIVTEARNAGEIIVTHDLDYGHLLAFSGSSRPSVIIFRLKNSSVENMFSRLAGVKDAIETALSNGAIVVIEDATLRVRHLPVLNERPDR